MDHDRLFKQLLREFFADFLALLLPEVAEYVDPDSLEFLDKEIFTDLTAGDRHEVDLLVKCRFRGRPAFFLIHVETQASAQENFVERMFIYFARLLEKFRLPVYPIALLTYDTPLEEQLDRFDVKFPDREVLSFQFRAIQLNRLNWRDFVRRPNPVAAALMVKMQIAPEDRPRVKLECLRLMATLKLNRARQALIRDFMDSYLRLNAKEMRLYNEAVKAIDPPEREAVMQIVNEWEARGEANMVIRVLNRRFGSLPAELEERIRDLSATKSDNLDALLDLDSMAEVEAWLISNG